MTMKITAGLGSIDDYIPFAEAGADEFFIGYVPEKWTLKYGIYTPLNRREVLYYNVQIGSKSELEILSQMVQLYKIPVRITFNALYYLPEQYPLIAEIMKECMEIGFNSFIVADYGLILYLHEQKMTAQMHLSVSGEISEMNHYFIQRLKELKIDRIIFHRKMTLSSMKQCTEEADLKFEAFALNENCHFHGAFCNSLHCDELAHICQVPYQIDAIQNDQDFDDSICGATGCGLCSLWDMKASGISHLKLVGRGNHSDCMEHDIKNLKMALHILDSSVSKSEYIKDMKNKLFPNGCSENCYY